MIYLHLLLKCLPCIGSVVSEMTSSFSSSFTNVGSTRSTRSALTSLVFQQICWKSSKPKPTKRMPSPVVDPILMQQGTRSRLQALLIAGLLRMNLRVNPRHQTPVLKGEGIRNPHPKQIATQLPGRRTIKYCQRALILILFHVRLILHHIFRQCR